MTSAETSLETFVGRIILEAKQNRGQTVNGVGVQDVFAGTEGKWASNLRAIIPENTRPSIAGLDGRWRDSDHKESWQSRAKSGSTANAIATAHDFADDVLFANGNVPFRVSLVNTNGQNIGSQAEDQAHHEKNIEDFLDSLHSKCDAIKHLLFGWDMSTTYGPRFFHVYYTKDDTRQSGLRAAFEAVNCWECFWDMDNEGDLSDGEYFLRRQRKTKRYLMKWARMCNASSITEHGGKQVQMQVLKDAFRYGRSSESGSIGVNNTSSQTGTPETDDLLWQTKTEVWDELWVWMPRKAVDDYAAQYPDAIPYRHPDSVDVFDANGVKVGEIDPPIEVPSTDEADAEDISDSTLGEYVWCMVHLVNEKVVAVLPEPGELPYRKNYWHRIAGCRDDLGIADRNSTNQVVLDGLVKGLENDLKKTHTVIAYAQDQNLDGKRIEEVMARPIATIPIDRGIGAKSIADVFSATNLPSNADIYIKGMQFYQTLADLDSGFPRISQGQKAEGGNTAFELKQRLENSGRHCGSKIRAMDSDIVWINKRMLEMEVAIGNIELPSDVEIKGGGFRAYSKQLGLYQTIFALMQYAEANPEIKDRMNLGWVLQELTECQGIDPEKFWISEPEFQKKQKEQQQSPQAQMQMQQLQAAIEKIQAATAKDNALAQKAIADAQAITEGIEHAQSRLQLDRAKGAMDIANKMRGNVSRMDRKAATMEPGAIVKAKPKQAAAV